MVTSMIKMEFNDQDVKYLRRILFHYAEIMSGPESELALRLYGDIDYVIRQNGEEETYYPSQKN